MPRLVRDVDKEGSKHPRGRHARLVRKGVPQLYILKLEDKDLIKIGWTTRLKGRVNEYRTYLPYKFYVALTADYETPEEAIDAEARLLNIIKGSDLGVTWSHGEWCHANVPALAEFATALIHQFHFNEIEAESDYLGNGMAVNHHYLRIIGQGC